MTNKQLAAARRAFRGFPGMIPRKTGETITPVGHGVVGEPVVVTEAMSESDILNQLRTSCVAING